MCERLTESEILEKVKRAMGTQGSDFQNETLAEYIDSVCGFLRLAGVDEDIIYSSASVGCIVRGVIDEWNLGSGEGEYSDVFYKKLIQLQFESGGA